MSNNTIPIFISSNDNYAMHLCVAIASVVANTNSDLSFYILYNDLSEASKEAITTTAGTSSVEFVRIDKTLFEKFDTKLKHISIETCFRYMIPEIVPDIKKAIYLDCDVIVLGDIGEYYASNISGLYAGVSEDFAKSSYIHTLGLERYFNSGVMLLNLELMREDAICEKLLKKSLDLNKSLKFLDQDVFNLLFKNRVKYLPLKWNATAPLFRKKHKVDQQQDIKAEENTAQEPDTLFCRFSH